MQRYQGFRAGVFCCAFVACCSSFVSAAAPVPPPTKPVAAAPPSQAEMTTATANGKFAIHLYKELVKENEGKNIFISPFSISIALTMATEGATGDTAKEMVKALSLPAGELAEIHRGQAALQKRAIPPETPAAVTAHVAALRTELAAANKNVEALQKGGKFNEAQAAEQQASKAANDLNALLKEVDPYELRIANAIWAEKTYPFKQSYFNALQPTYGAVLFPVDFRANFEQVRGRINGWVEEHTNNRIKDLIGQGALNRDTRMVLTNAVFFKGEWEKPFETSATRDTPFAAEGNPKLPMMHQRNFGTASYAAFNGDGTLFKSPKEIPVEMKDSDPSLYPDEKGFLMASLRYKGQKLSMTILAPQGNSGLADLEKLLVEDKLSAWLQAQERRTVDVDLPKFKLDAKYSLVKGLEALGMTRAFIDPREPQGAQFDKMTETKDPNEKLYITNVLHKTFVDVNEKGTEAAAATAVIFAKPTSAAIFDRPKTRPFIPIFKADKPFLFMIRENDTGSILFMGRYLGPT